RRLAALVDLALGARLGQFLLGALQLLVQVDFLRQHPLVGGLAGVGPHLRLLGRAGTLDADVAVGSLLLRPPQGDFGVAAVLDDLDVAVGVGVRNDFDAAVQARLGLRLGQLGRGGGGVLDDLNVAVLVDVERNAAVVGDEADVAVAAGLGGRRLGPAALGLVALGAALGTFLAVAGGEVELLADLDRVVALRRQLEVEDVVLHLLGGGGIDGAGLVGLAQLQLGVAGHAAAAGHFVDFGGA